LSWLISSRLLLLSSHCLSACSIHLLSSYNLRTKITITVFSAAILSITILAVVDNLTARSNLLNAVNQTLQLAARQTAADVDAYLADLALSIQTQAQAPTLSYFLQPQAQQSSADARRYLQTMQIRTGGHFYALIDRGGQVLLHTSIADTTTIASGLNPAQQNPPSRCSAVLLIFPFFGPTAGQESLTRHSLFSSPQASAQTAPATPILPHHGFLPHQHPTSQPLTPLAGETSLPYSTRTMHRSQPWGVCFRRLPKTP
jgi:hypothetical protein